MSYQRSDLCLDELAGHARQGATGRAAEGADKADESIVGGGESSDVVWLVVGIGAGEGLATRDRRAAVLGEDHLDALGVGGVDYGGDIEVVRARITVPADLTQHAGDVGGAVVVRVPVADPGVGEGHVGCAETVDDDAVDGSETFLGSEDDVSGRAVLVDELDCVGRSQGEESRSGEEGRCELHFASSSVF